MNILWQILVQKKVAKFFENIIIFEKISSVDMGQVFASFLQFGQFFQNMSPINAKSLWEGSLMMLHQKTEKTLVEISRKLENPAVKGLALQVKVPPKQGLLDIDYGHHH
jgi:hypothetical protein